MGRELAAGEAKGEQPAKSPRRAVKKNKFRVMRLIYDVIANRVFRGEAISSKRRQRLLRQAKACLAMTNYSYSP